MPFPAGVPQASVISPTLFNVHIDDLEDSVPDSLVVDTWKYADDCTQDESVQLGASSHMQEPRGPWLHAHLGWQEQNYFKFKEDQGHVNLLRKPHANYVKFCIFDHDAKTDLFSYGVTLGSSLFLKSRYLWLIWTTSHCLQLRNVCCKFGTDFQNYVVRFVEFEWKFSRHSLIW